MSKLKILELFGGIGACSKALERLEIDYEIVDYVEIDKYAVKSFNAIHNTNFEPQDICEWDKDIEVDLIMHGSPCQDFSLAGKQAGGDKDSGTRSSLMYETIRIVEKLKPKYVVWENVKNLLSKNHRHNFDAYLETMEQLGYVNYYQVLNAKDYGIPQNRERVFTISILNGDKYNFPEKEKLNKMPIDILEDNIDEKYYLSEKNLEWLKEHNKNHKEKGTGFIFKPKNPTNEVANTIRANASWCPTDNAFYEFPPKQELKLKLKDMLEDEVDEKYYLSGEMIKKIKISNFKQEKKRIQKKEYCDTLLARDWKDPKCVQIKNATKKGFVENHYQNFIDKNGYVPEMFNPYNDKEIKNIAPTQSTCCGSTTSSATVLIKNAYLRNFGSKGKMQNEEGICDTLQAAMGNGGGNVPILEKNIRIRKLTPKECWRLMGFDDEDFEKASKVNSNTQLYKQAGNSIVVNVLEAILKELLRKENDK